MNKLELNEIEEVQHTSLELISNAYTEDAISLLKKFLKNRDKELYSQLVLISRQYSDAQKKILLGLGNKEKTINRVNMTLVIFINNLEYNLIEPENNLLTRLNKTEQTSSKNYTTIGFITLTIITCCIFSRQIWNYFGESHQNSDNEGAISFYTSSISSTKNKITLIYKSDSLKIRDTLPFYINLTIKDVKSFIVNKHNLVELTKNMGGYTVHGMNEAKGWSLICAGKTVPTENEDLTLDYLIASGRVNEYDEINLIKDVHLSKMVTLDPEIRFNRSGSYLITMAINNPSLMTDKNLLSFHFSTNKITFSHLGIIQPNEIKSTSIFFNPIQGIESNDSILSFKQRHLRNNNNEKNGQEPIFLYSRYGLKPDNKIYIISEEDEND